MNSVTMQLDFCNQQNAREIANRNASETDYKETAAYDSALEMAKFKDTQFKNLLRSKKTKLDNKRYSNSNRDESEDLLVITEFISNFYYEIFGEEI